jgi:hypothetical protein
VGEVRRQRPLHLLGQYTDLHLDAGMAEHLDALPRHVKIGVQDADDDPANP